MLGAPGAGKGTQAKRIARKHSIAHVSTGEIFRNHVRGRTPLGRRIAQALEHGQLMPDDLTCEVLWERLTQPDCAEGYVLDGFPRSVSQAESLSEWLAVRGEQIDAVLELLVPDEEIIDRTSARRSCLVCGAIFNMKYDPPKAAPYCDRSDCPSELVQRDDDNEATLRKRLWIYDREGKLVRSYFDGLGLLRPIPASGLPPDALFRKIEDALQNLGASEPA
jgi:adenylate kinase